MEKLSKGVLGEEIRVGSRREIKGVSMRISLIVGLN